MSMHEVEYSLTYLDPADGRRSVFSIVPIRNQIADYLPYRSALPVLGRKSDRSILGVQGHPRPELRELAERFSLLP